LKKLAEKFIGEHPSAVDVDADLDEGGPAQVIKTIFLEHANTVAPKRVYPAGEVTSLACPIPGCDKSFSTLPGIVAHFSSAAHDLWLMVRALEKTAVRAQYHHPPIQPLVILNGVFIWLTGRDHETEGCL